MNKIIAILFIASAVAFAQVPVIDFWQQAISDGRAFTATYTNIVGISTNKILLIKTPARNQQYRIVITCDSSTTGRLLLYENTQATNDGTLIQSYNMNRPHSRSNYLLAYNNMLNDVTSHVTNNGTILYTRLTTAGQGYIIPSYGELVLKTNSYYSVQFFSFAAANLLRITLFVMEK